jgi:hypothetical protein
MPDVAEQQRNDTRNGLAQDAARRRALEESVILLAPSFGWYRGQYQLPKSKTDTQLDGKTVEKGSVTTPRSKLMTDTYPVDAEGTAWKKRLQKIESRQKALIEKYSVPFPIRGVRIVPKAAARHFFRELDDVKRDLQAAADEFVANLDSIIEQMKHKTPEEVYKAVEHKIPKQRDFMRAKFYIDVVPVEIAGSADRPNVLTETDLAQHYDMVREACQRKVEEAVEAMIEKPREQLAEALAGLKDVINRSGKVTQKSFKPVYEAMKKLRAFSFVANDQLLEEINTLERRMRGTVPTTLDQITAANSGFTAALDSLMTEVEDAEQAANDLEEFGREHRAIDLG